MICPHCGAQNSEQAVYCQRCGRKIDLADQMDYSDDISEEVGAGDSAGAKRDFKISVPIMAAAVVLIAALIVFFVAIKPNKGNTPDPGASTETTEEVADEAKEKEDNAGEQKTQEETVKTMYVSSEDGLMLREGPSKDTESIYVLSYGTEIKVEKTENNWAYTKVDDLSGWCSMDYLTEKKPEGKKDSAAPSSEADKNKIVEPSNIAEYGYHGVVNTEDGLNMRYGPGENYDVIQVLSKGLVVTEYGWDGDWMYIKYAGQYGWVYASYISPFEGGKEKPAIYLYPTKTMDVNVKVKLTDGRFTYTDPKGDGEWNVTASPNGKLIDKASGKSYDYIFWESDDNTEYDWSEGYVIEGRDSERFLRRTLPKLGLNESESTEFIEYWLPRMEKHKYNLITFQTDCYTDSAALEVSPKPDSVLRVFMVFKEIKAPIEIKEPVIKRFDRKGFTVVEWGGAEK
ncbi:MAG: SH3 domain-containing protein [Mogibacterium sp.]|nr:SH3 domain-containing protein [Mogibacterium sp.]